MEKPYETEREEVIQKYMKMIEYEFSEERILIPRTHYDFLSVLLKKVYEEGFLGKINILLN